MKNEEVNLEENEENLSYLKEIESNTYFKENIEDALLEKSKLPVAYDDSFNEETHYSLLKELEDKWSYIEKTKPIIAKRQHSDTTDSVSLKTNSRSRIQDWKAIIEESKKKYQQKKKVNALPTEDFASFIKAKVEQLQMISNKYNNTFKDKSPFMPTKQTIKSFLKDDLDDSETIAYPLRNSLKVESKDQPLKISLINTNALDGSCQKKETAPSLNHKVKDVFFLITDTNNTNADMNDRKNKNMGNINNSGNRVFNDCKEKDLTMTKLKRHFNAIMTQITPSSKKEYLPLNTSLQIKPRVNITTTSNRDYQNTFSIEQPKTQIKIRKKISENTALLNELLPCTKKPQGPYHYYSNAKTHSRSIATLSNISQSVNHNRTQVYSKNNFQETQAKLYAVYSNKIKKLIKE